MAGSGQLSTYLLPELKEIGEKMRNRGGGRMNNLRQKLLNKQDEFE